MTAEQTSSEAEAVRGKELMCDHCGCTRWACLTKFDAQCCGSCEHPAEQTSSEGGEGLSEAEACDLHAPHSVPINYTRMGCPICPDYQRVVERILADRLAAVTSQQPFRVAEANRLRAESAEAEAADLRARLGAVEALVAGAEAREAASLSRTFDGGSFGTWVDATSLRAALASLTPLAGDGEAGARHIATDPRCSLYAPPTTPAEVGRFDEARGLACPICEDAYDHAQIRRGMRDDHDEAEPSPRLSAGEWWVFRRGSGEQVMALVAAREEAALARARADSLASDAGREGE